MARPRVAVERPPCPDGHTDGVVWLHGSRPGRSGNYEKTRWRCVRGPRGARIAHYWTAPRRTPTPDHPDGIDCGTCEHPAARAEGPTIVPAFGYAVAEAARSLVLVGEGDSLRLASQKLRYAAGRFTTDHRGNRWASRQNALAADYLDNFGPAVVRAMTPAHWPRMLALDSQPLGLRIRDATNPGFYDPAREGGAVLVAAGRDRNQPRTRNWISTLAGDETADSWWDFLHQIDPEPAPFWVVADGSKAIRNAVAAVWPKAVFYPCEEHLRNRALLHAAYAGLGDDSDIKWAIAKAFWGIEAWTALGDLARSHGPSDLLDWWVRTDPDAQRMVELKHRYGDYLNGNGPAEAVALAIRERIGERTRVFRNADRLATVIALMGIDLAEQASVVTYGRILRTVFEEHGWDPERDWEGPHDYYGEAPSIDEMLMDAWDRAEAAKPVVMQDAVSASVMRKAETINVLNLATGVAPLEPTIKPGRKVASVSVAGKFLRDYPHLMAEWDTERNEPVANLGAIKAGAGIRPHWHCPKCGNRWRAWLTDRTSRLTQCRTCNRKWADEKTSIASLYPDLVPEWDPDGNGKRGPDRTKATSERTAVWLCLTQPIKHDPYFMSPRARVNQWTKGLPGCPPCRRQLTQAAQRAKRRRAAKARTTGTESPPARQ